MMKDKKGMELAMNTIVVAAIALIVLVVVILIFTGGMSETIEKFRNILGKSTGEAACVVVGLDPSKDADGDGYLDDQKKTYTIEYKDNQGKKVTDTCICDAFPEDSKKHKDPSNTNC